MKILKVKIRVPAAWNNHPHGGWRSQAGYPKKEIGNCN